MRHILTHLYIYAFSPVIIEVPHFASLKGREREIVIMRSDNGETWREHTLEASEEAVREVLNQSFENGENGKYIKKMKLPKSVNLTNLCIFHVLKQ